MFGQIALLEAVEIQRIELRAAAGTSDLTSDTVDMEGFDRVAFVALFDAIVPEATLQLIVHHSDAESSGFVATTFDDDEYTSPNVSPPADDGKMIALDINRPAKRYLRLVVNRGAQNATLDGVIAIKYRAKSMPVTQPSASFMQSTILGKAPAA